MALRKRCRCRKQSRGSQTVPSGAPPRGSRSERREARAALPRNAKGTGDEGSPSAAEKVPAWWLRASSHPRDSSSMASPWVNHPFLRVLPRHSRVWNLKGLDVNTCKWMRLLLLSSVVRSVGKWSLSWGKTARGHMTKS